MAGLVEIITNSAQAEARAGAELGNIFSGYFKVIIITKFYGYNR